MTETGSHRIELCMLLLSGVVMVPEVRDLKSLYIGNYVHHLLLLSVMSNVVTFRAKVSMVRDYYSWGNR
jgi:hypothetical protein